MSKGYYELFLDKLRKITFEDRSLDEEQRDKILTMLKTVPRRKRNEHE